MGDCYSVLKGNYVIYVKTGDQHGAGTDATIQLVMHNEKGEVSKTLTLDHPLRNDFERGNLDEFPVSGIDFNFGRIFTVEFWRNDSGVGAAWFCELISIRNRYLKEVYYFPVHRWIRPNFHYKLPLLDCSLPQYYPQSDQRRLDLKDKRDTYQLTVNYPGLPAQIRKMPDDEAFSNEYKWDIMSRKAELILRAGLGSLVSGRWDSVSDINGIYVLGIEKPYGSERWMSDDWFGQQRLSGCNPRVIKLCTEIPDKLGVTRDMIQPLLDGWSLQQMLDTKRIFIVDHEILEKMPTKNNKKLCAPIGLFFANGKKQLVPIAIQLEQQKGPDNPVFLPTDDTCTWRLAKMWFNLADSTYHQACSHLGFTHFLMEGVCITTHRQLSQSHPIFKLLAPHFLFLIAINTRGLEKLVSTNGWVDNTMTVGREGLFELIRRGFDTWRLSVEGDLERDLINRGVLDDKILPGYYYRDDGLPTWRALRQYVKEIIELYYSNPDDITKDAELQAWREELVLPREQGGVGLLGVSGHGCFEHKEELVATLAAIIFSCSVQHAATNFNQYDEYGFPPNYPALLNGEPPKDKLPRTEADLITALPDKSTTRDAIIVTKLLSEKGTQSLGDFEIQYQYDPRAVDAVNRFRAKLKEISETIQIKNQTRRWKYDILDPVKSIPNSISI